MPKNTKVTAERRREWLRRHEAGESLEAIARTERRALRTVREHVERARMEQELALARREQLKEALGAHQQDLLALVARLREAVHVPALEEELLPQTRNEVRLGPYLPVGGIEAQPVIVVKDHVALAEEKSLLWHALTEHLGLRDALWKELWSWKRALLAELRCREALEWRVQQEAESLFGLPVAAEPQKPRLTPALIRFVRVELTRRALGQSRSELQARLVLREGRLEDSHTGTYLASQLQDETALDKLAGLMVTLADAPEVKAAARSHRELDEQTTKARRCLEAYTLIHYIRGWCSLCMRLGA